MIKSHVLLIELLIIIISCSDKKEDHFSIKTLQSQDYDVYGEQISSEYIYHNDIFANTYDALQVGDTIDLSFTSTVNSVCKAKGCWMRLATDDQQEVMVKFKNYGFFVPKDIEKDTVIVQGSAFVSEISVADQRHFARDAGKTDEEIAAITAPKKTYSFIADGVLIKK